MSIYEDFERDSADAAKYVNEDGLVISRYGPQPKKTWLYLQSEFEAAIPYTPVGTFADGFTYTSVNQTGIDADGNYWIYNGATPFTVAPGTVPSEPDYTQAFSRDHSKLVNLNIKDAHDSGAIGNSERVFKSISDMQSGSIVPYSEGEIIKVDNGFLKPVTFIVTSEVTSYALTGGLYAKIHNDREFRDYVVSLQSMNSRKPNIRSDIENKFKEALSSAGNLISATDYGVSGGLVFGSSLTSNIAVPVEGIVLIAAPASGSDGNWNFSVDIELIDGADYADLTVTARKYDNVSAGMNPVGSGVAMTRSGSTYTLSGQNFTNTADTVVGIEIIADSASSGLFGITAYEIEDNAANIYNDISLIENNLISFVWSQSTKGCTVTDSDGFEVRVLGARSGYAPSAIYTNPTAVEEDASGNAFVKELKAYSPKNPMVLFRANELQQTYYHNDIAPPVLIMAPGTYNNTEASRSPLGFRYTGEAQWPNTADFYAGCPNGMATISANGNYGGGAIYARLGGADVTANVLNVTTDSSVTRPFRVTYTKLNAVNCHSNYADTTIAVASGDGWEFDFCDFVLQDCSATGATNDGFNHHGFGHGILIDCVAHDNEDDGFSPHDDCTYEVWGGEYYNNGKGNIIPAFGARGFCNRVKSYGCTGLSTRVSGDNYGGFVCLSRGEDGVDRDTFMALFDCETDDDIYGINSAGDFSFVWAVNTPSTNQSNSDLLSGEWGGWGGGTLHYIKGTESATLNNLEKIISVE